MKTKTINPGWYTFMVLLICILLGVLMNSCNCKSDDGVVTYNDTGTAVAFIVGTLLMFIGGLLLLIADRDDVFMIVVGIIMLAVGFSINIIVIWNTASMVAVSNPMYEKQYVYKQVNDTLYIITDSIYIKLH